MENVYAAMFKIVYIALNQRHVLNVKEVIKWAS